MDNRFEQLREQYIKMGYSVGIIVDYGESHHMNICKTPDLDFYYELYLEKAKVSKYSSTFNDGQYCFFYVAY